MTPNKPDPEKTERLLRQFYAQQSKLRGYIFSATRNYHATEDILQSVAIVTAQKASSYDFEKEPAPWFIGIAKNHIKKWYTSQGRSSRNVSLEILEQCIPDYGSFETDLIASRREALNICIGKLPDNQRTVVQLRYMDDLDCPGIAEKIDRPVQGVYSLLKRLKIELRKCVEFRLRNEGAAT